MNILFYEYFIYNIIIKNELKMNNFFIFLIIYLLPYLFILQTKLIHFILF